MNEISSEKKLKRRDSPEKNHDTWLLLTTKNGYCYYWFATWPVMQYIRFPIGWNRSQGVFKDWVCEESCWKEVSDTEEIKDLRKKVKYHELASKCMESIWKEMRTAKNSKVGFSPSGETL